jgi:polyhydroxyalkanoate synthesis regulator phasin
MMVLLDIKESKASFFMELINNFSFVKAKPVTNEKALLLQEIQEAVDTVNLVKKGKLSARPAKELLNEI